MKGLMVAVMGLFLFIMSFAATGLPFRGDPQAPANVHVSPYYLEETLADTATPNVVTSVLLDYRGYDTFGETIVIFTAGLACVLILWRGRR